MLLCFDVAQECVRSATICADALSDIVLVSGVPLYISLQQCIEHISPKLADVVLHVQVVTLQDDSKTFGLLLKCVNAAAATELVKLLHGSEGPSAFNEIRLAAVQVLPDVMPTKQPAPGSHHRRGNSPLLQAADATFALCSICLDPAMDTFNGTCPSITTICAHTFHLHCIAKCNHGEPCPLCRYDMLLLAGSSECEACGSANDLWMCLVCGVVNCGRSKLGHAFEHFRQTKHSHVSQVGGSRVWDYELDAFVHHLAIPDDGGAPVPAATPLWCDDDEMLDEVLLQSKIEVVNDYYSRILNSQLEQQQKYFEGLLSSRSTQSVVQLENVGRIAIVRQAAFEAKALASSFAATMKSLVAAYQKRLQAATHQGEFLRTTLAALTDGNDKLHNRVTGFRPTTASGGRVAELEREVERLFVELSK